ncbi:MAG: class I adenylate-forming enzyme family protein [Hyphomicrobiaceae bacterium]
MLRTDLIAPIPELLARQAAAHGNKVAYEDAAGAVTYAELRQRTGNLAGHLAETGIGPGDSVAMLMPNSVAWVETSFAITRAGAISVPISYDSTESEIAYRLADAGCRAIVTTDEKAELVEALRRQAPALGVAIYMDRGERRAHGLRLADLLARKPCTAPRDPRMLDEPAFIVYTSGTTGRAKGVILTVRGMLWVASSCWAPICGLSAEDRVLSPLPLFHSYALNISVMSILATGASEFIMERFSTAEALERLKSGRYTVMPGVPTMFHYLLQRARESDAGARDLRPLRLCISAGAIMPAPLNREFESHFGVQLLDGYGITETSTMVTMNWPTGGRVLGSCGLALPGLAVRIVDPVTDKDVAVGAEGELIVRGPNVMPGYHNKPKETEAALRDGWYRTGDLARADENGFLTITGRLKELIIRGGQNIAPAEIEEVVTEFGPVLECAVIGMPHQELGEVPVLCVVPRSGESIETQALIAHCRTHLSAYKVPQTVHIVREIPRTGSGKIMRFKLKEALAAASAGKAG